MRKLLNLAKWGATLGSSPQNFLGTKWVLRALRLSPKSKKRIWALRLLSLSPHYFLNPESSEYAGMSNDEYLEAVFDACMRSRRRIYANLFKDRLESGDTVLDYGCGPGFLAKVLAENVKQVYACDISQGALACGQVLNPSPNLHYILADNKGLKSIPDGEIDAIVSLAMIQHLSDDIYMLVLENCRKKLKAGGRLLLHVQLLDEVWRSEEEWKADTSIKGRLKFRYGLHCFGRTEESHREMLEKHGFKDIQFVKVSDIFPDDFREESSQGLLTARKPE